MHESQYVGVRIPAAAKVFFLATQFPTSPVSLQWVKLPKLQPLDSP